MATIEASRTGEIAMTQQQEADMDTETTTTNAAPPLVTLAK
jgi:hypothetical protein